MRCLLVSKCSHSARHTPPPLLLAPSSNSARLTTLSVLGAVKRDGPLCVAPGCFVAMNVLILRSGSAPDTGTLYISSMGQLGGAPLPELPESFGLAIGARIAILAAAGCICYMCSNSPFNAFPSCRS
jgi:hypothetical protein